MLSLMLRGALSEHAFLELEFFGTRVPLASCGFGYFRGGYDPRVPLMTTLQAMWLGAMMAWTPSLVVLAWLLREAPLDELDRDPS